MYCTNDTQTIATTELNSYLEQQAQAIAPIPVDETAAKIRLIELGKIREAIVEGEYYWQKKQNFKKLKDFKHWLEQQGFTWRDACKHIKLYETFAKFPLEQIGWLSLDTLSALCQPKYKQLLEQLRLLPRWIDSKIQELMKAFRNQQKIEKPKRDAGGLINLPSGGRAFQFPLLHDDGAIAKVLRLLECRKDVTPVQLLGEAIALLFEREERDLRCKEEHLKDYKMGTTSLKYWQHNARVLQRARGGGIAT